MTINHADVEMVIGSSPTSWPGKLRPTSFHKLKRAHVSPPFSPRRHQISVWHEDCSAPCQKTLQGSQTTDAPLLCPILIEPNAFRGKVQKLPGPLHKTGKQFHPPGCPDAEHHPLPAICPWTFTLHHLNKGLSNLTFSVYLKKSYLDNLDR